MYRARGFSKLAIHGLILISLTGCSLNSPTTNTPPQGSLAFRVNFPEAAAPADFQIYAIPAGTNQFQIEITGDNMTEPLTVTLDKNADETEVNHNISLPVGEKTVKVTALQDGTPLAADTTTVVIKAGERATAELDLQALTSDLVVKLARSLPLDLAIKVQMTGAGLENPLEEELLFNAGDTEARINALPPGEKDVNVTFQLSGATGSFSSEGYETTLTIESGEPTEIELKLEQILKRLGNQLNLLPQELGPLQLIGLFLSLPGETVSSLRDILPSGLINILKQNATLAELLGLNSEPTETLPEEDILIMDAHLLNDRAYRPFSDSYESIVRENVPEVAHMTAGNQFQLLLNTELNAIFIRIFTRGESPPELTGRAENLSDPNDKLNNRTFKSEPINTRKLSPNFYVYEIPLNVMTDDGSVPRVEHPGDFRIELEAKNVDTNQTHQLIYKIRID